jgi:phosphatidylserine decarboxylase
MACISVFLQRITPQHLLTRLIGWLADVRAPWFKNLFIACFIKKYRINMKEAAIEDYRAYPTFNEFFIRKLKPELRPITQEATTIISPADGAISQIGKITQNQLLQAKGHYFDLESLLGGNAELAHSFYDGNFATIYLAPHNYHRVHMPLDGKLVQTIYVPGKLFSVNQQTAEQIPQLFSRNERLICVFESDAGRFALIFVGAMIVGSIQTIWMDNPIRNDEVLTESFMYPIPLTKGAEVGHFKLGSTVILLFEKDRLKWQQNLQANSEIQMGQLLGHQLFLPPLSLP